MSILIDGRTRLCVAGITGREGRFHAMNNRRYGTQVVSGVTPGKGGGGVEGVPVFDTFDDAVADTGADAAMIFVPARLAGDSILEAADAGIELIVAISEGIPAHDELRVVTQLRRRPGVSAQGDGRRLRRLAAGQLPFRRQHAVVAPGGPHSAARGAVLWRDELLRGRDSGPDRQLHRQRHHQSGEH